jgi:uncharacterized membrane protein YhiD involved in acid resistance
MYRRCGVFRFTRAGFGPVSDRHPFSGAGRGLRGWDREKRARSAGLRTFPLVALASCGFVQASENLLVHSPDGMAKVIEGLITGIGFIGGGAILKQGTTVQGTATAASLGPWQL